MLPVLLQGLEITTSRQHARERRMHALNDGIEENGSSKWHYLRHVIFSFLLAFPAALSSSRTHG